MTTAVPTAAIEVPSALLALTELPRALADFSALVWAAPFLAGARRGDGHAVLVLPGFTADDGSTAPLRHYLQQLGYDARSWELGKNFGPKAIGRQGAKLL